MNTDEICRLSIYELSRWIKSRDLSPVDVIEAHLARIETLNSKLGAFITVCGEEALQAAKVAEGEISRGHFRGPLHGIPFGAKDIFDTAGILTTHGSSFYRENVPAEDAESIRRLKEAGAILIGKCNTHEFATGTTTKNPFFGNSRNPWNPEMIPGGSSGGSAAAVASFICPAATGSDTGGSIRGPAALCGVVGLKPTYGLVSLRGVYPNVTSLDHAGPLARSARDCGLFLQGMAGYDPLDPVSVDRTVPDFCDEIEEGVKGLRLGICEDFMATDIDAVVTKAFEEAVKVLVQLGAQIEEVRFTEMERLMKARVIISRAELFSVHRERFANHPEGYGEDTRERIEAGREIRLDEYIWARREKELIRRSILDLFHSVDAFLTPTCPCVTGSIDTEVVKVNGQERSLRFISGPLTSSHTFTGVPAIAVPSGFSPDGLPVSLQILGPPWGESLLLRIAHAFEEATPEIRNRRPPVS